MMSFTQANPEALEIFTCYTGDQDIIIDGKEFRCSFLSTEQDCSINLLATDLSFFRVDVPIDFGQDQTSDVKLIVRTNMFVERPIQASFLYNGAERSLEMDQASPLECVMTYGINPDVKVEIDQTTREKLTEYAGYAIDSIVFKPEFF